MWDAKTKALIVLPGLKGELVAAICQEPQLSQAPDYHWRDHFLVNASKPPLNQPAGLIVAVCGFLPLSLGGREMG